MYLRLMLVTALLALIALTGCKTPAADPEIDTSGIIKAMMPEHPDLPEWPQLSWSYQDGRYSLDEADVDKILDYWENRIPQYRHDVQIYLDTVNVIIEHL